MSKHIMNTLLKTIFQKEKAGKGYLLWFLVIVIFITFGVFLFITLNGKKNSSSVEVIGSQHILGVFDKVGLYQKNGRVEEYGLDIYQHPAGPIKIDSTQLRLKDDVALFTWFPDHITATKDVFPILIGSDLDKVPLILGLVIDNKTYLFYYNTNTTNIDLPDNSPEDITKYLRNTVKTTLLNLDTVNGFQRLSSIPTSISTSSGDKEFNGSKIDAIFLILKNAKSKNIDVHDLSIYEPALASIQPQKNRSQGLMKGVVEGVTLPVGTHVEIRTEDNQVYKVQLSLDQHFVCNTIPLDKLISVSYKYNEQDFYTQFGRWFEFKKPRDDLIISVKPGYINTTGRKSDPKSAKLVGAPKPEPQDNIYPAHTRLYWNGVSSIQCYKGEPFTNNLGYIDRDRFVEKPKNTLRILHIGGSSSVALQIKPFEKYNILLEQELGVRLGRPVEVISIGRDNGDIGTHLKRLKFFIEMYKPDLVLIETMSALMMQIQPNLLRLALGFDFNKNIFPHFAYDKSRNLYFVDLSPEYALYTTKPVTSELTSGVPLWDSLKVPFEFMHPYAKEAWEYSADIFSYYQNLYPEQKMALHTGIDLAQCKQPCKPSKASHGFPYGAAIFIKNAEEFYNKKGIKCISPTLASTLNHPDTMLTFQFDGHYSERGHQWIAKELAILLENYFKAEGL